MDHLHHFILQHDWRLDPERLRDFVARQDNSYDNCHIYDLRSLPILANEPGILTREQALKALIGLRHVPHEWVRRRRVIVLLPAEKTDRITVCLAQMRSVGILGVVVAADAKAAELAQEMSANLSPNSIWSFE